MARTQAERIVALETKGDATDARLVSIEAKLDDLLALRHKGIGAFWVASAITGTGIIGAANIMWEWLKA